MNNNEKSTVRTIETDKSDFMEEKRQRQVNNAIKFIKNVLAALGNGQNVYSVSSLFLRRET